MALKRDLVMQAVSARMATILVSNGFRSDIGSHVIEWRPQVLTDGGGGYVPTEQEELPAIHVRDTNDQVSVADLSGNEDHELTLELEIAHEAGATGQTMRKQAQDVRKVIGVDRTWGGLARADYKDQAMTMSTVRLKAEQSFFRTLIRTQIIFTTSAFGEE